MDNEVTPRNEKSVDVPQISRDAFLNIYEHFQSDLFRSVLNESDVEQAARACWDEKREEKKEEFLKFFKLAALRYRKSDDVGKALKYFYQASNRLDIPLVYILKKEAGIVSIFIGCVGSSDRHHAEAERKRFEATWQMLPTMLPGFLPGSSIIAEIDNFDDEARNIQENFRNRRILIGIPNEQKKETTSKEKNEGEEQPPNDSLFGIERVLDSVDDDFMILGYAEPVSNDEIMRNQAIFSAAHDFFHVLSKQTAQINQSHTNGTNDSLTESEGRGWSDEGTSKTIRYGDSVGRSIGQMFSRWWRGGQHSGYTDTRNKPGDTHNEGKQKSRGTNTSDTSGSSLSVERTNELARQTEALLNRQMKRLEKGLSCGMWRYTTQIAAKTNLAAERVANILQGFWGGDNSTLAQIRSIKVADSLIDAGFPLVKLGGWELDCLPETPFGKQYSGISTLLTTDELVMTAPLPQHEVPGILVEKLTDYGRNFPKSKAAQQVGIGKLIDHERQTEREVQIDFKQLQRHAFVTGATGAGKSTTMRQLLINLHEAGKPFLVIEPIKREYRELKKEIPNLNVITLGASECQVSINPFEIEAELGLIPHIDNLKAAFNATMGNYSSMPFILEDMIYRAYEECGWDLNTGTSTVYEKMKAAGFPNAHTIPIMEDLLPLVSDSINNFFPNQSDYGNSLLGALRARISSMTRGAKGNVLNSLENTISMGDLLRKPCVIELWPFTDNEEKAFIMALLLIKLYEYRQKLDIISFGKIDRPLDHVLVIEEAHRLLAKPQSGGEHSSNGRQKAVEFFADILAEIRSYGQGIVIVDQIPSKLVPDVLKNTDVKIAHRLADKEDRDIIGATMNLTQEQIKDLARLSPGEAIVYFGGLRQAMKLKVEMQNKIEKKITTNARNPIMNKWD